MLSPRALHRTNSSFPAQASCRRRSQPNVTLRISKPKADIDTSGVQNGAFNARMFMSTHPILSIRAAFMRLPSLVTWFGAAPPSLLLTRAGGELGIACRGVWHANLLCMVLLRGEFLLFRGEFFWGFTHIHACIQISTRCHLSPSGF